MKLRSSAAYKQSRSRINMLRQRAMLIAATVFYVVIGWQMQEATSSLTLIGRSIAFAIPAVAVVALTLYPSSILRLDGIPVLAALIFGAQTLVISANTSVASTLVFAFLFVSSSIFVVLLSEHLRAATLALTATVGVGVIGGWLIVPLANPNFSAHTALLLWLPNLVVAAALAWTLEHARREAFTLSGELERRATSDNLTGVSNRAHINLLAQNEFARARRYTEPFSCIMLEIDEYEKRSPRWGVHATDAIIQVLSGYCVVIMRHCDSFGRLSSHRFLALLPETEGEGALTLARRMCEDISGLTVSASGESLSFTISIGAAELHNDDRWAGDILRRAEQALDDAIERGGNTAVFVQPPSSSFSRDTQFSSQEIDPESAKPQ